MDQEAWNQVYADLESELASARKRGSSISDLDVVIAVDRARFAMERGDSEEAIAHVQEVRRLLQGGGAETRSPTGPAGPLMDRLDSLEDGLHATTRLGSARLEIVGEDEEEPTRAASQNTKVDKSIKYDDIKDEYLKLWNACRIRPEKQSAVRREADRVVANRKVYEAIAEETDVPWWFVGLIHGMECSFSLGKHLHNGDSLKARTWQVPAGRPKDGSPPFEFEASAADALEYDGFAGKTDWPLSMVLFRLERYNGFGYRRKFGFASPYLWSYTSHFSSGKYVKDGVFDPNAISKQCGAAAMLRDLMERGIVSFEDKKPEVVVANPPAAAAKPEVVATNPPAAPAKPEAVVTNPPAAPAKPEPVAVSPPAVPAKPEVVVANPPAAPSKPEPLVVTPSTSPAKPEVAAASPPAEPAKPEAIATPPAPVVPAPAPAPAPVAPVVPAAAAVPTPVTASVPADASPGVSPAIAAALAELAKRSR